VNSPQNSWSLCCHQLLNYHQAQPLLQQPSYNNHSHSQDSIPVINIHHHTIQYMSHFTVDTISNKNLSNYNNYGTPAEHLFTDCRSSKHGFIFPSNCLVQLSCHGKLLNPKIMNIATKPPGEGNKSHPMSHRQTGEFVILSSEKCHSAFVLC